MLSKKCAIITGGTSGIGKEIAINFAKNNARVAIIGRSIEKAKKTIDEINALNKQKAIYKIVDITNENDTKKALLEIINEFETIDILVNNAGITKDNLLLKMEGKNFDSVLNTNLKSIFNTCKTLYRPLIKQKFGKIINISSVVGIIGNAGQTNYCASKAAIIGFTKALAKELASRNINANCIAPGFISTETVQPILDLMKSPDSPYSYVRRTPLGAGHPRDVGDAAAFLASEESKFITGSTLVLDGGFLAY